MRKQKLLEFTKKRMDFEFKIPPNTSVSDIECALALFIIDNAKFRNMSSASVIEEIRHWVAQLEDNL